MSRDQRRTRRRASSFLALAGLTLVPILSVAQARALVMPLPTLPLTSALPSPPRLPTLDSLPTLALPTLPPPTLPLPTISPLPTLPVPSISPVPSIDPRPTVLNSPSPRPGDSSPGASPSASPTIRPSDPPSADATSGASPSPIGAGPTFDDPGPTEFGGIATLGDIVVPALIVGVPSLVVLGIVLAQLFGAAFWIPVIRRMLGPLGLRRSPRRRG